MFSTCVGQYSFFYRERRAVSINEIKVDIQTSFYEFRMPLEDKNISIKIFAHIISIHFRQA